ncbi:hypothetical protein HY213_00850 [Candidatus Peregrinibacteria bacterium]|nr:hypothetical protein [Candidatus Peregrinibacteria bacterium]
MDGSLETAPRQELTKMRGDLVLIKATPCTLKHVTRGTFCEQYDFGCAHEDVGSSLFIHWIDRLHTLGVIDCVGYDEMSTDHRRIYEERSMSDWDKHMAIQKGEETGMVSLDIFCNNVMRGMPRVRKRSRHCATGS